jgi:hypothetical protein
VASYYQISSELFFYDRSNTEEVKLTNAAKSPSIGKKESNSKKDNGAKKPLVDPNPTPPQPETSIPKVSNDFPDLFSEIGLTVLHQTVPKYFAISF